MSQKEDKEHLFLSDVHLGAFNTAKNENLEYSLIRLIEYSIENGAALYILGDLFDYWMEYPEKGFVPTLGKKVLDAFEKYNNTIQSTVYITGNHDNWTYGHFKERGFEVEPNFKLLEINQKRMLLMHGDGVAASSVDFPRAAFHKVLRSDTFVNAYQKILPPKQGIAAMKMFSSVTRRKNNHNPEPLNRQAKKIFDRKRHNLDYILSGHDHVARMETFSRGTYINPGAYFMKKSLAVYNKEGFKLVTWEEGAKNFLPLDTSAD